jgi:hypothetical protein
VRPLRALTLGALAGAVLGYVTAAAVGLLLSAAGAEITIAAGPVVFLSTSSSAHGSETTLGPGLLLLPVLCGAGNAVAAAILAGRSRSGPMA